MKKLDRLSIIRHCLLIAPCLVVPQALKADALNGRQLYEQNCASCHGKRFQGTGLGPALSTDTYVYGGLEWDIVRIATNGIVSRGMPSFADTLDEAQLTAIAQYVPTRAAAEDPEAEDPETEDSETESPDTDTDSSPADTAAEEPQFDPAPGEVSTLDYLVKLDVVADNLDAPWAIAFPDPKTILVTERVGRLRVIRDGKLMEKPVAGTPEVLVNPVNTNQGGLLDIALDPDHPNNGWIYLSYSHPINSAGSEEPLGMIRVVRGKIKNHSWTEQEVVYEAAAEHYSENFWHYGGRLAFDAQGYLYISVGDRGAREQAREPASPFGKFHRLHPDGRIPADNPLRETPGALSSIFSLGHRNSQGIALHPSTGQLWAAEHGPRGGDELNILKSAGDYGWSVASYGINYDGTLLTPHTRLDGVEQPVLYWRPSIGVSGLAFYQGREFPLWNNKLLVTALARKELRLITLDGNRVQHQETLITFEGRPYEPAVAPDGSIYIVTDSPGQLLRLSAIEERKL